MLYEQLMQILPEHIQIEGILGKGGQGTVFKGTVSGTPSAIKLFDPQTEGRRLKREIDLLRKIHHPNLPAILDVTQLPNDGVLIAYEFLDGGDLVELLGKKCSAQDLHSIAAQIGSAVEELWKRRIVHRDIKPANIVRAKDGRYVLVDIGLARHLDQSDITATGWVCGTRGYMAPEQSAGRRMLTIRADVFSLGLTLYILASTKHPFANRQCTLTDLPARKLSAFRPDLPENFCNSVDTMLELNPAKRPASITRLFVQ